MACELVGTAAAVAFSSFPGLVKVEPPPWSAVLSPGLSSAGTKGVVGGTHEVLLGAMVAATVWGCGKEKFGVLGERAEGSDSTEPVKLPL